MPRRRSAIRQTAKDIAGFSLGSITLGAGAKAVAPFGSPYGAGLSTMGSMLPPLASTVMLKSQVGMLSESMEYMPTRKRRRR